MSDAIEKLSGLIREEQLEECENRYVERGMAKTILAAIRADITAFVPVKKLEWEVQIPDLLWEAWVGKLWLYNINEITPIEEGKPFHMYATLFAEEHVNCWYFATLELAKAAAQTHYENQWRKCIA